MDINTYKNYINKISILLILITTYYGILQRILFNIYILIYLFSETMEILNNTNKTIDQLVNILKKWACYAFYLCANPICDFVFLFLPLTTIYYLFKLFLFLWIVNNISNIDIIYNNIIIHYYEKYKTNLHNALEFLNYLFNDYRANALTYLLEYYNTTKTLIIEYITNIIKNNSSK